MMRGSHGIGTAVGGLAGEPFHLRLGGAVEFADILSAGRTLV